MVNEAEPLARYDYKFGGGHGVKPGPFMRKVRRGGFKRGTDLVDCSGLIRLAQYEATGVKTDGDAASYLHKKHWHKVHGRLKRNDIVVKVAGGGVHDHIAIVVKELGHGRIKTFDAAASGIGYHTYPRSFFNGGARRWKA
jgi:hypothetical protein